MIILFGVMSGWLVMERLFIFSILVCILGIFIIIAFNIYRSRSKKEDMAPVNDHALFPALNESALKKHISFYVEGLPYKDVIDNIQLHKSTSKKYQIIVKCKDTSRFESLKSAWNANIGDLFNEDFKEVYSTSPANNIEDDWGSLIVDPSTNIPNYFKSKEKWTLHK